MEPTFANFCSAGHQEMDAAMEIEEGLAPLVWFDDMGLGADRQPIVELPFSLIRTQETFA